MNMKNHDDLSTIMEQALTCLAGEMVQKIDCEVRAALDFVFGQWTDADVKRRCETAIDPRTSILTLYADGVPLLEIHPARSIMKGYTLTATQNFRRLYETPTE